MIERYYFEFSKVYCRLMRLEMQIKHKLIHSILPYYKENVIKEFEKFFYNKDRLARYTHKNGNVFLSILKNPQIKSNSQKFIKLINQMYLSDILFMFICCEQFHKPEITENFYLNKPEKFGYLKKARQSLLDLRNAIAHYNFKDYEQNKHTYLDTLKNFEYYMGSGVNGIPAFPQFNTVPSVKTILLEIKKLRPDLFDIDFNKDDEMEYFYNKHRILLDLCDDIALYNGYSPKDLPSPWTVLRQMYAIKHNHKNPESIDINTLPLFKNI